MKKLLLTLLFGLICVFASGQIQRSFWDASLGVSQAGDVLQKMQNRNYTCVMKNDGRLVHAVSYLKPLVFANVEISSVQFGFFQDSCYQVTLAFKEKYSQTENEEFSKIQKAVERKYHSYLKDRRARRSRNAVSHSPASPRRTATDFEASTLHYSDGKTSLTVDEHELTVTYTDEALYLRKDKAETAELYSEKRFLGCTFGVTTYAQALDLLAKNHPTEPSLNGTDYIEKTVTFAGAECRARFSFHKGVFYKVGFKNQPGEKGPDFAHLRQKLNQKYKNVCVKSGDDYAEYNNTKTRVTLRRHAYEGSEQENVTLEYTDVKILQEKENVNLNEI